MPVGQSGKREAQTEKSGSVDQNVARSKHPRRAGQGQRPHERGGEGEANTEKSRSVDQKAAARWERVEAQLAAAPGVFAVGGTVVTTWRTYRGRRLGPYFRLAYRKGRRQCSIYLGRSAELARRVRDLLARLQEEHRWRRTTRRMRREVRRSLRRWLEYLGRQLAQLGIERKGFEFRGVRRALAIPPAQLGRHWQQPSAAWTRGFL